MSKSKVTLSSLYEDSQQAAFLQSQYFVEGALMGACACPEIPMPDAWLPWVIKHHGQVQNDAQANAITDVLFAHFKACLAQMHDDTIQLPVYVQYSAQGDSDKSNSERGNLALSEWCEGLLMAHTATEKSWQSAWNKMQQRNPDAAPALAKNLKHCLLVFSTFAEPNKAIKEAAKKGDFELSQKLPMIAQSLEQTLLTYIKISGNLAAYLPNQFETFVNQ